MFAMVPKRMESEWPYWNTTCLVAIMIVQKFQ